MWIAILRLWNLSTVSTSDESQARDVAHVTVPVGIRSYMAIQRTIMIIEFRKNETAPLTAIPNTRMSYMRGDSNPLSRPASLLEPCVLAGWQS